MYSARRDELSALHCRRQPHRAFLGQKHQQVQSGFIVECGHYQKVAFGERLDFCRKKGDISLRPRDGHLAKTAIAEKVPDSAKYDTYSLLTRNCTTHKETSVIQPEHPQRNDVVVGIENIVLHNIGILNIGDLLPFFVPSTDLKRVSVYKKDRPAAGRKLTIVLKHFTIFYRGKRGVYFDKKMASRKQAVAEGPFGVFSVKIHGFFSERFSSDILYFNKKL